MSNSITTKSGRNMLGQQKWLRNSLRLLLNHICIVPAVRSSWGDAFWYSWEQPCILLRMEFFGTPRINLLFTHSNKRTRILRLNPHARMAKLGHTEISGTEELDASAALEHRDMLISLSCIAFRCFRIPFSCTSIILQTCNINDRQVLFLQTLSWVKSKLTRLCPHWETFYWIPNGMLFPEKYDVRWWYMNYWWDTEIPFDVACSIALS